MKWLRQVAALTILNIRTLPQRLGSSTVAVVGIGAVVAVFAGVLSMANGFERTVAGTGSDDIAIVLRDGSNTELTSGLSLEHTRLIAGAPGVRRDANDEPIVSAELFVIVELQKKTTASAANAALRGIQANGQALRKRMEIVEGRMFEPGKYEIIVGRGAQHQFVGLELGNSIRFGQTEWTVVGVFADGGSVFESELWCDVRVLQPAYRRGSTFQTVRAQLVDPASLATFEEALESDPRLEVDVFGEREYYAEQAEPVTNFIRFVGYPLAFLMAIGAIFAAINTMYSSVSARSREIATLRALGFGPSPIALATLLEAAVLGVLGGILGGAVAYLGMNARTASTLDMQSFSQVAFNFAVTGELLIDGLLAALAVGLLGGLFPAVRAARVPVAVALRGF